MGDGRYITPEALFGLRFGEHPRPTWDVAILSFRGDGGTHTLVSKLNARPLHRKVLYGVEVSQERPLVYEATLADRRIVLVTHCLWGGPQTAILAAEVSADAGLAATVTATATRLGIAVVPVRTATVDALYRETPADVERWLGLGAQAINMETTPLYAAAAVCGVRAVWFGHISDALSATTAAWESWQRPAAMTDVTVALLIGFLERAH